MFIEIVPGRFLNKTEVQVVIPLGRVGGDSVGNSKAIRYDILFVLKVVIGGKLEHVVAFDNKKKYMEVIKGLRLIELHKPKDSLAMQEACKLTIHRQGYGGRVGERKL